MVGFAKFGKPMSTSSPSTRVLRFDTFELDLRSAELRKQGVKLRLQGQPLQLLAILLTGAGNLVTHEELRSQLWPADTFVDFNHSLHNAIGRIRETLGDSADNPRYIETLPRRGYRFIARVDEISSDDSAGQSFRRSGTVDQPAIHALAVLPLEDLSGEPGQEYFADGMTEALITTLAKIKALRVISRTSAMRYKRVRKSLPQIARELHVDAVIEGSVLRSGDRVRITAQLIHARSDQHLWAESYERDYRDILSLQSAIALEIAGQVKIILTPEDRSRLVTSRQVNPQAHELYLKARYHWSKRTEQSVKKSVAYFLRAIDQDPTYAHGYAGLADAYNILGYYNMLSPQEAYPKAKAAALQALELDASLGEPHATLGVIKRDFEWDWPGAEQQFQRSIHLNPGYAQAHHWRATLLSMLGSHTEALSEKSKALEMDPLSVVIRSDLARIFYFARDYQRSLEEFQASLDMDPNFATAHLWLAHVYEQEALYAKAISELQIGMRLSNDSTYALAKLGHCYGLSGRSSKAHAILKKIRTLSQQQYVSPYDVGMIYVGLGQIDDAFLWLERAFAQRSLWLGYLNVEPQLDTLRSDERFYGLLRRIGLLDDTAQKKHLR